MSGTVIRSPYMESEVRCSELRYKLTLEIGKPEFEALTLSEVILVLTGMADRYAQHMRKAELDEL